MTPSEIADALEARHKYDKVNYPPASPLDRQAAATIRAQSEALKIATEALKEIAELEGNDRAELAMLKIDGFGWPKHDQALARIKEVG